MKTIKSFAVLISSLLFTPWLASAQTAPVVNFDSENNMLVVVLNDGDSLLPKLSEVVKSHSIKSGLILANLGQLRNFTLSFYDVSTRETVSKSYFGPYDFAVTQGTIAHASDGSMNLDIVALFDSVNTDMHASNITSRSIGGHVAGGIVSGQNVILIKRLDTVQLIRNYQPENGTWDLDFKLPTILEKETAEGTDVKWRREYNNARPDLFGANPRSPVFDVAGRRINRLPNGRIGKMAPGLYVAPRQAGKKGSIITQ